MKNEGQFTVRRMTGGDYEINCNNFYSKDGFLVIEHKDEDIEYLPIGSVACVVKYKSKEEIIFNTGRCGPSVKLGPH